MSHPIEDMVGFRLAKILKLKRRFVDAELKSLELSRTQWQVLLWLRILGSCTQKELLHNLDIDAAHLARILEEFEKKEFVVRSTSKEDRRSLIVQLTPYSQRKLIPKIEAALEKENTHLLKGLKADEKQTLKKILEILENNIKQALEIQ